LREWDLLSRRGYRIERRLIVDSLVLEARKYLVILFIMPGVAKPSSSKGSGAGPVEELETWIEKVVDGKDSTVTKQMLFGGVSGW